MTTHRTISLSATLGLRVPARLCAGALLLFAAMPPALAQGRLDAFLLKAKADVLSPRALDLKRAIEKKKAAAPEAKAS